VSLCQKSKSNLDFTEERDSEWQWHQLGHMQVCTSLPADNMPVPHHSRFFTGRMPFLPPNQQRQSTEGNLSNTTNRGQKCGMTVQPECDIFNLGLNAAPPTVFHLFCRMTNH